MQTRVKKTGRDPQHLVGSWVNGDEYATEVEYVVSHTRKGFTVRALDRFDGEEGAVYDVCYSAASSTLSFNVQWKSTGRFMSVRLVPISPNRVSYTCTYTQNQMWFRKGTEPPADNKPSASRRRNRTP